MSSVDLYVSQQNAYRAANGIPLDYNAMTGSVPAGGNGVIGFENYTFSSGCGTVVLDGPKTSYEIQVDSTGKTTIKDIGTGDATYGQTVTVTGEDYIVFNGANLAASTVTVSGAPTYPNDAYFIENTANAQLAQFYAAMLQRSPDMGGLDYWEQTLAAWTPTMGATGAIVAIANEFLSVIHTSYSTGSPITTLGGDPATMTNTQYVTALYNNVLDRAPDAAGLAYWVGALDSGTENQAEVLVNFTNATALTSAVNVVAGSSPGTSTGWLINYSQTGGYADPGLQLSVATVLNQEASTNYLNTALIDPSTIPSIGSPNAAGISITAGNMGTGVATSLSTPSTTIILSANVPMAVVVNDGNTIIGSASGGDYLTVFGSNTDIQLSGVGNTLWFGGESSQQTSFNIPNPTVTNNTVMGYVPGADHIWVGMLSTNHNYYSLPVQVLAPSSSAPVSGASLNFTANEYVLNVGNVGTGTAAEVVAAANAVYTVGEVNGNPALAKTASFGENLVIIGQSGGNTVIYQWANISQNSTHQFGAPFVTADTNGNHLIDASEIHLVVTLVGVTASALTPADFQ